MRARIQSGLKKSKRDLAKTQAEYEMFKKYKTRSAYWVSRSRLNNKGIEYEI
jgi:hypothetical protein